MLKQHDNNYRGRFAPSPSGDLHFGSLVTAMASYADARSNNGNWIIRIDDIDKPRVQKGSTQSILNSLEALGFQWDERIYYQSDNQKDYLQIIDEMNQSNIFYRCYCTRKEIQSLSPELIYPGTCKINKERNNIRDKNKNYALRVDIKKPEILFIDVIQGDFNYQLNHLSGDFIVYRSDQIVSYLLAFVIDNYLDNITHIIRGFDLLDATPKQIFLQQLLSYPIPQYAHIPIITNSTGIKLSKSCNAKAVDSNINTLINAAKILGQRLDNHIEDATIDEFWQVLIKQWDISKIPKLNNITFV
ncbi:MAG: tRNA glutamyl-Q(34) synthetase GluQRS [Pseudomonadota bacterium]